MAGGGAIPMGALREDPLTILLVADDDDMFRRKI